MLLEPLLAGVALPALLAGGLAFAGWTVARRLPESTGGGWVAPLAIAAGYVAGHVAVWRWRLPPQESTDWIATLAMLTGLLGIGAGVWRLPAASRWLRYLVLGFGIPAVLLRRLMASAWDAGTGALHVGSVGLVVLLVWLLLDRFARTDRDAVLPVGWIAVTSVGSVVLLLSGGALPAQLAGVLAAAIAAALVAGWLRRGARFEAAVIVYVSISSALWIAGVYFVQVPRPAGLLLACAPTAVWITRSPALATRPGWVRAGVGGAAAAAVAAVALGLAWAGLPEDTGYGY